MKKQFAAGFTLIEMSIVLVIIGMLTGGILYGRSLLIASRLQTVMTDVDSFTTAIGNFKRQYQALPGDMPNATANWGTDSSGCPSGGGTSGTCNGNGDGEIASVTSYEYEAFRFWQHLYYAGMYPTRLSGVATSGTYVATNGVNAAQGSVEGSGFSPVWEGTIGAGNANFYAGYYGNVFIFGASGGTFLNAKAVLTTDQAASIDAKVDDGMPGTGNVRSFVYNSTYVPGCTTSGSVYNVSASGTVCALIFTTSY